ALAAAPPATALTSSPGLPTTATGWPSFTTVPAGARILRSVPLSKERYSIVALSVSTSARRSSMATLSPSFLCQTLIWPSSIVGESLGISRTLAMSLSPFAASAARGLGPLAAPSLLPVRHGADPLDDPRNTRNDVLLELRVVRHRIVERRRA